MLSHPVDEGQGLIDLAMAVLGRGAVQAPDILLCYHVVLVKCCSLTAGIILGTDTFSPTEVGALLVVAHPDNGQCLSFYFSLDLHCCW